MSYSQRFLDTTPQVVHPAQYDSEAAPEVVQPPEVVPFDQHLYNKNLPQLSQPAMICGIRPKAFWILALAITVILAAAIGAGVGGGLASQKKSSTVLASTTSPSLLSILPPTSTSVASTATGGLQYTVTAPGNLYNSGCHDLQGSATNVDGQIVTPTDLTAPGRPYSINNIDLSFLTQCNTDYPSNDPANSGILDLQWIIRNMSTIYNCLSACAVYNTQLPAGTRNAKTICSGVAYELGYVSGKYFPGGAQLAQCWLKAGVSYTSTNNTLLNNADVPEMAAALLQKPADFYG
ncbi:hypothetical protein MMC30_006674 [Trapelia coarctata]|nr:hypothetical protein [Trapelia coarctata]